MKKIYLLTIILMILSKSIFSQSVWYVQNQGPNQQKWINSVYFADSNTGWAVGDSAQVFKTTNGGKNWTKQLVGINNYYSVNFIDSNTGWAVGGGYYESCEIIKTTNSGINWYCQLFSHTPSILRSIKFIDENTGWAVGDYSKILKTTNGGANWITQTSAETSEHKSVSFIDNYTGWIFGNTIQKTTNGGTNWISQTSWFFPPVSGFFIDNNTGWIVGDWGLIKRSTNGGINWENQYSGYSPWLSSVQFINNNTGWAAGGQGIILKTTNSGINWIRHINSNNSPLKSIYFINDNQGWAVGASNTILATSPNDVGITSIIEPASGSAKYEDCMSVPTIIPKTVIKNFGVYNEYYFFDVYFEIKDGNTVIYSDVKQDTISIGQSHTINFSSYNLPFNSTGDVNVYKATSWISLPADKNNTNDTMHSVFTVSNPNYGYSDISNYYFLNSSTNASCIPDQPVYNWEDTTGSVNLISNGVANFPFTAGNIFNGCFRLPDVLLNGEKFKFFGTCFDTIVISTNGIIGLGGDVSNMTSSSPVSIPSASAPKPAIFPFWYSCNYFDPEIIGRNLKYKVTDNKFIITYDRVPLYNAVYDSNDFATYQVILETGIDCGTDNGKIKIQFNYDKCGSTFINNYYNNNLNAMTVGIQNSSGTIALQYRRSEANQFVTVPGPLFGSPLAIDFAQINSVLPVELESFTSLVQENNVSLNWRVSMEISNAGFDIERSSVKDELPDIWSKAGFVQSKGQVTAGWEYSYEDKNLSSGKYKYRLKQKDFNGSFKYYNLQNEVVIGIPVKFVLSQNYPNPFNPSTKIKFEIPYASKVVLKIYDNTGKEMKTLVNEFKAAGYYTVDFSGINFASGVYFYKIIADGSNDTKRMILLK